MTPVSRQPGPGRWPLSPAELARLAGVHVETVRRACRRGRLEAERVSGRLLIPPTAADAYLGRRS